MKMKLHLLVLMIVCGIGVQVRASGRLMRANEVVENATILLEVKVSKIEKNETNRTYHNGVKQHLITDSYYTCTVLANPLGVGPKKGDTIVIKKVTYSIPHYNYDKDGNIDQTIPVPWPTYTDTVYPKVGDSLVALFPSYANFKRTPWARALRNLSERAELLTALRYRQALTRLNKQIKVKMKKRFPGVPVYNFIGEEWRNPAGKHRLGINDVTPETAEWFKAQQSLFYGVSLGVRWPASPEKVLLPTGVVITVMKPGYEKLTDEPKDPAVKKTPARMSLVLPWCKGTVYVKIENATPEQVKTIRTTILEAMEASDLEEAKLGAKVKKDLVTGIDVKALLAKFEIKPQRTELVYCGILFNTFSKAKGAVSDLCVAVCISPKEANAIYDRVLRHYQMGPPKSLPSELGDRRLVYSSYVMFVRDNVFVHISWGGKLDHGMAQRLDTLLQENGKIVRRGEFADPPKLTLLASIFTARPKTLYSMPVAWEGFGKATPIFAMGDSFTGAHMLYTIPKDDPRAKRAVELPIHPEKGAIKIQERVILGTKFRDLNKELSIPIVAADPKTLLFARDTFTLTFKKNAMEASDLEEAKLAVKARTQKASVKAKTEVEKKE
jgi:hypothetical protein